jgi:hypothetical protein
VQISGNWDVNYSKIVLFAFYRPSGELAIIIEIMESELQKTGVFVIIGRSDQTVWDRLAGMFTDFIDRTLLSCQRVGDIFAKSLLFVGLLAKWSATCLSFPGG